MIEVGKLYRAQLGTDEADWCYVLTVARSTDAQGPVFICRRISLLIDDHSLVAPEEQLVEISGLRPEDFTDGDD